MCANAAFFGPAPLLVSGCAPFARKTFPWGVFCLVYFVRYGEIGDATIEGAFYYPQSCLHITWVLAE